MLYNNFLKSASTPRDSFLSSPFLHFSLCSLALGTSFYSICDNSLLRCYVCVASHVSHSRQFSCINVLLWKRIKKESESFSFENLMQVSFWVFFLPFSYEENSRMWRIFKNNDFLKFKFSNLKWPLLLKFNTKLPFNHNWLLIKAIKPTTDVESYQKIYTYRRRNTSG